MADWLIELDAARNPRFTTPVSRHAAMIATALHRGETYPMLQEDPQYCGETIGLTVLHLWQANAKLAKAADEIERLRIMVQTRDQENSNLRRTIAGLRS